MAELLKILVTHLLLPGFILVLFWCYIAYYPIDAKDDLIKPTSISHLLYYRLY